MSRVSPAAFIVFSLVNHVASFMTTPPVLQKVDSISSSSESPLRSENLEIHENVDEITLFMTRSKTESCYSKLKKKSIGPCHEHEDDDDDHELNRREAAFAMVGTMWSLGGMVPAVALSSMLTGAPQAASATYGDDAKMTLPNIVEGMTDRINKQCLVESLGNRECLLYLDPENKLYQGDDNQVLLSRLEKASAALASIPDYVEDKKWSQVLGVVTGPMGELVGTMNQLIKISANKDEATALSKMVKADVLAIGAASDRKDGPTVLDRAGCAEEHLVQFVSSL
mmetsp:Transcript_53290/g.79165  ORF Transcript_53290/g.79165 Transcript_53290/m.79165 type:complete len:283 (+) Transcript_53290:29-877(+)|eukprot:CAMPEP_0195511784 /NCGR_PEP_ID=MMETSP0794_2-20130614/3982_1 /TAXON_ID=515487 /ORGANISM="Stephanopyxis turris, Strain CCMP 815" /LENGTH=282 /DNA_ID=CAMNT_0040639441 /DNA_START=29 /DNA_END=877 /DNA_ORIENTATION=+